MPKKSNKEAPVKALSIGCMPVLKERIQKLAKRSDMSVSGWLNAVLKYCLELDHEKLNAVELKLRVKKRNLYRFGPTTLSCNITK